MTPQQKLILEQLSFPRSLKTLYNILPHISQSSLRRTLYEFHNKRLVEKTDKGKWCKTSGERI